MVTSSYLGGGCGMMVVVAGGGGGCVMVVVVAGGGDGCVAGRGDTIS